MFDAYQEHCDFTYATDTEWDRAEADQLGSDDPSRCWVCTDRDAWHKNPYYKGVETPHPESYTCEEEDEAEWAAWRIAQDAWEAEQQPAA